MRHSINHALFVATLACVTLTTSNLWAKHNHSQHHSFNNSFVQPFQAQNIQRNKNTAPIKIRPFNGQGNPLPFGNSGRATFPLNRFIQQNNLPYSAQHESHEHKHHHGDGDSDSSTPLDPGRGDGGPTSQPTPTSPLGPGFVWVNNHWERVRATSSNSNVRDHRGGNANSGGVSVQPTTPTAPGPGFVWVNNHWERVKATTSNSNVRDHRGSSSQPGSGNGGVTVQPTTPTAPGPGFVWVNNHWERVKAPASNSNVRDHRGTTSQPGSGNGGVTVQPTTPTAPGPGFVWVNNHWERVKAPASNSNVRDHRGTTSIVRDHRGNSSQPGSGGSATGQAPAGSVTVRDHRGSNPPGGGTSVTVTPGGNQRNNDVIGVGGSPIDDAINWLIDVFDGADFDPGTPPANRDHRN